MREWLIRLVGTALAASAAVRLTPQGASRKVTQLACAVALVSAMLSVKDALTLTGAEPAPPEIPAISTEEASRETRYVIEERLREYILERARALGAEPEVSVTAAWSEEGFWYPSSVRIEGAVPEADRLRLAEYIREELMIPKERQEWIG